MTPASNGQGEGAEVERRCRHLLRCIECGGDWPADIYLTGYGNAQKELAENVPALLTKLAALRAELAEAKKENGLFRGIIRAAYLDALDSIAAMTARALNTQEPERRLTHNQQLKLGRDLATYGVRESAEATAALLRAKPKQP